MVRMRNTEHCYGGGNFVTIVIFLTVALCFVYG